MSGECKSYKLNKPMTWVEFKQMPDDIRITYIKLLREKFGVTDRGLIDMFGCSNGAVSHEMKRLGINAGKAVGKPKWDREGFLMWCKGVPIAQATLPEEETQEAVEEVVEEVAEVPDIPYVKVASCIPKYGTLSFEGTADEIANTIRVLLCGAKVKMDIRWDLVVDDNG